PFYSSEPEAPQYEAPEYYEVPQYTQSGYRVVAPEPAPTQPRSLGRRLLRGLAAAGAFLAKFGAVLYKLKVVTVAGSMIVSIGAYALLGGWWFGVGLVGLIFVHEMGHVLALRRQGV